MYTVTGITGTEFIIMLTQFMGVAISAEAWDLNPKSVRSLKNRPSLFFRLI